jgi:hypothetical protein
MVVWAGTATAGELKWEKDFDSARKRSLAEGKLLFIDIWADH